MRAILQTLTLCAIVALLAFVYVDQRLVEAQEQAAAPAKPAAFNPSEVQQLRLTVRQRDVQIAYQTFQTAQQNFLSEAERIKKDNNWPDTVKFDPQTMSFRDTPPAPPTTPAKKP